MSRNNHSRMVINAMPLNSPICSDMIRFVCISDTHAQLGEMSHKIPNGDVLIHSGDFTNDGSIEQVKQFSNDMLKLPHKYKIVIAGNHERGFEKLSEEDVNELKLLGLTQKQQLLSDLTYLQDNDTTVYGYKIYGAPWHPMPRFDFHVPRGVPLKKKWDLIPTDTDILITHTPPLGFGDMAHRPVSWIPFVGDMVRGCEDLLNAVQNRVCPKYHIFGHIHSQHGLTTNGTTTFVNASICDKHTQPVNDPIIFDLPSKSGISKNLRFH